MNARKALLDDLPPAVWHSALELVEDHIDPCFICAHPEHPATPGVVWSQVILAADPATALEAS